MKDLKDIVRVLQIQKRYLFLRMMLSIKYDDFIETKRFIRLFDVIDSKYREYRDVLNDREG